MIRIYKIKRGKHKGLWIGYCTQSHLISKQYYDFYATLGAMYGHWLKEHRNDSNN